MRLTSKSAPGVCNETMQSSTHLKKTGVIFDSSMSMEQYITEMCKSALYHLRNTGKIRKYLFQKLAIILVLAFVTSNYNLLKPYVPKRQLSSSIKNFLSIEPYKLRAYGFRAFFFGLRTNIMEFHTGRN